MSLQNTDTSNHATPSHVLRNSTKQNRHSGLGWALHVQPSLTSTRLILSPHKSPVLPRHPPSSPPSSLSRTRDAPGSPTGANQLQRLVSVPQLAHLIMECISMIPSYSLRTTASSSNTNTTIRKCTAFLCCTKQFGKSSSEKASKEHSRFQ